VHKRILAVGRSLGERFFLLNFEQLCVEKLPSLRRLTDFLDIDCPVSSLEILARKIHRPASIGRYRNFDPEDFDPKDVAFVGELGYDTSY
jgi:hypothetical protein